MRAERLRREEQEDAEKGRIKKQPPKEEGLTVTSGRSVLKEGKKENNEKAALSYEEISLFYKKFLEENHDKHVKYSR